MPQRTNTFQTLFLHIQTVVTDDGLVEESAMVRNSSSGRDEEIDVLITFKHSGLDAFRIGIQCRDHSRKGGPSWIRDLSMQGRQCGLSRMVAVHSKGFTKAASTMATAEGVELITLSQADTFDWNGLGTKSNSLRLHLPLKVKAVHIAPLGWENDPLAPKLPELGKHGIVTCTCCGKRYGETGPWLQQYLMAVLEGPDGESLKRQSQRIGGPAEFSTRVPSAGQYVIDYDGKRYPIDGFDVKFEYCDVLVEGAFAQHRLSSQDREDLFNQLEVKYEGVEITITERADDAGKKLLSATWDDRLSGLFGVPSPHVWQLHEKASGVYGHNDNG